MSSAHWDGPLVEQVEPRLLMSGSDVLGDLLAPPSAIDVATVGTVSTDGSLGQPGATETYQFTAKASGRLYIDMKSLGGGIDPCVELLSEGQRLLVVIDLVPE